MRAMVSIPYSKETENKYHIEAHQMRDCLRLCSYNNRPQVLDPLSGHLFKVLAVKVMDNADHDGLDLQFICFAGIHGQETINVTPEAWQQLYEEITGKAEV